MRSWAPNTFRSEGEQQGYPPAYLSALVAEGDRLQAAGVPVIFTLGHLAKLTRVPYVFLDDVVARCSDPYRVFRIKKRRGGYRQIVAPDPPLLAVQRWLHENILIKTPAHSAAAAFAIGKDAIRNAQQHCDARWLVKLDVTDFFEAISERQVYRVFQHVGYAPRIAFQLSRICTRLAEGSPKYRRRRWKTKRPERFRVLRYPLVGHLPQGAPTSPLLSNLVCVELDRELVQLAEANSCTYSRYADDIVFSAADLGRSAGEAIVREASAILGRYGLNRNRQKTLIAGPTGRRVVTGLLVDSSSPRLLHRYKQQILVHLYHARTKGIYDHCVRRNFRSLVGFKHHLDGLIGYAERVEPTFGAKCRGMFDALAWGDLRDF